MHPILKGDYPPVMRRLIDASSRREGRAFSRLPKFTLKEVAEINGTADYFAPNYYTSRLLTEANRTETANSSFWDDMHLELTVDPKWPHAKNGWLYSVPEGLKGVLR